MSNSVERGWKNLLVVFSMSLAFLMLNNAAQAAPPCSSNCIRVFSIDLTNAGTSVRGIVKVWDETGSAGGTRSAVLHVVWTRPDGSTLDQYDVIGTRLRGEFSLYTAGVAGTYTMTVVDATKAGYTFDPNNSDVLTKDITVGSVGNQPPVAVPNADISTGVAPLVVSFDSTGSNDSDGSIVSYNWSFGDGGTSTEENPVHTYTDPGSYTAVLSVVDNTGVQGSNSVDITVSPSSEGCLNDCLLVDRVAMRLRKKSGVILAKVWVYDENGNAVKGAEVSAEWLLPDGSTVSALAQTNKRSIAKFLFTADTAGVYTIRLTDVSGQGASFDPVNSNVLSGMIEVKL